MDIILNCFGNVWIKNYSSSLVGYWSKSGPFHSRIFSLILLLIFSVLTSAQPTSSTQEVPMEMYNLTCYSFDKHPPHRWGIESWIKGPTRVDLPSIILFTGIMFTVFCFYNKRGLLFAYSTYGTGFLIKEFNNLTEKIKNLIEKIWIELKENRIEYLGVVYEILNISFSSSLLMGAQRWKSNFIAGISIFAFFCYCVEVSVELRRVEVTRTYFHPERMNNIVVWFFTKEHVLRFLVPLLTCDYKIRHMEDFQISVSFIIQMFINAVGQLAFMYARDLYDFYATN